MMRSTNRIGLLALGAAASALALTACSKNTDQTSSTTTAATDNGMMSTTTNTTTTAPAAGAAAAPAADNTDTVSGAKFADFTGDPAKGEVAFVVCKTCHEAQKGVNKIGPSLFGVVGRKASSISDYQYSPANHASGITWTPAKLFQYLENPQRVIPGTKMAFAGIPDPQKRADVIAFLGTKK